MEAVAEVSKKVCNLRGVIGLWGRKGGDRCRRASLVHFMDTRYGMMSSPPVASHVGGGVVEFQPFFTLNEEKRLAD